MVIVKNENGVELEVLHSTFPAGEVYVRIVNTSLVTGRMYVTLQSADADSILRAIMVANAISEVNDNTYITLMSDYLPYSRQDRVCKVGESNSLKVFINMLDAVFNEIDTLDIHNPNVLSESSTHIESMGVDYAPLISYIEGLVIVAPDAGANERCQLASQGRVPVANLIKTRTSSGVVQIPLSIRDADLIADAKQLLIVDDICDGGATFLSAAEVLRGVNPIAELHLLVTHGIFSQGFEKLNEVFASVRCVNPYYKRKQNGV